MARRLLFIPEIVAISTLVLITRCANYRDVFAAGHIYFVDPDCYARMTRARICLEHPGTIIRHHDFENFPAGTSPHTTAPFDYLIVAIAAALAPAVGTNSSTALDVAGAIVSPLIAVALGIFLCWWTRRMAMRFRFALLALYALSPILAHGTALGRPDHQSLLIALVTVALCADWTLIGSRENRALPERAWNIVSAAAWALAIWVSLYEPLILLTVSAATSVAVTFFRRRTVACTATKWMTFGVIIVIAVLIERRVPALLNRDSLGQFIGWSGTIGELSRVSLASGVWWQWCSWLLLLAPILFWRNRETVPAFLLVLLIATFALTVMQARWAYFFVIVFALVAPEILNRIGRSVIAHTFFVIALYPVARAWDDSISEPGAVVRAESRVEQLELRTIASQVNGPLLGPWWFSPALAYWSRAPAVGGSSHESLTGITDSARFYAATEISEAAQICQRHQVNWVVAYDAERLAVNCAGILHRPIAPEALCYTLDRHPSAAPAFLTLVRQTARFKLYRVMMNEKTSAAEGKAD